MPIPNLLNKYGIEAGPKAKKGVPDLIGTRYNNFQDTAPAPVTLPVKPGLLSLNKASEFIGGAAEAPTYTGAKGEVLRNLPGEIVRTILPGAAAIQDNPEEFAQISNRDIASELPGVLLETGKEIIKAPVRGATELPGFFSAGKINPEVKFNIPFLGEVTNSQYRLTQKALNGEQVNYADVIGEKAIGLLDALFFVSLIRGGFTARPKTVATGVRTPPPSIGQVEGPKSFRLYEGPKPTSTSVPKEFMQHLVDQGVKFKSPVDPNLPTYFQVRRVGKIDIGEIIQMRPSYFDKLTGAKLPSAIFEPVPVYSKEVKANAIDEAKPIITPSKLTPPAPTIAPKMPTVISPWPKIVTPKPVIETLTPEDIAKEKETAIYNRQVREVKTQLDEKGISYIENAPLEELQKKLTGFGPEAPAPVEKLTIQPEIPTKEKSAGGVMQPVVKIERVKVIRPDQLVTKTEIKQMLDALGRDSVDFRVIEEGGKKYMAFKNDTHDIKLRPSALGLVETNITPGQIININAKALKSTGTGFKAVSDKGDTLASLASDLAGGDDFKAASTPSELKKRIEQLNKFGQSYAILRRTGALPKKAAGMFRHVRPGQINKNIPTKGIVHLKDEVVKNARSYMSTLAHELGHALEFTLTGKTNVDTMDVFGRDLTKEQKTTIREELKAVTNSLVGEETAKAGAGYYYKNTELLARFLEKMFVSPGNISEMAPTTVDLFEKSAIENPIIAEYLEAVRGTIDKGELKHILFRDMRQIYIKELGTRVGNIAWNNEVRYRAMKERAKIMIEQLIKEKFKKVDDEPDLLFQAAESITVTKGGVPKFGTRDFQYAKNDIEIAKLMMTGYKPIKQESGEKVYEIIDGKQYPRFAKIRYTPEQGQALFDKLSPEGQQLIEDFTAAKEEAVDYFNREMIKDVHKINSELEGWVHHYWEDKPIGPGGKRLQMKIASAKKERKGAEGYVEDLQKAMTKALTELESTKSYNAFIEDYFAQVTKAIAKGQEPDTGWIEVVGNIKKGGIGTAREMRTVIIKDGKAVPAQQVRYQMPAEIYQRFQMIREVSKEASLAVKIINNLNRYWRVNILFHAGSAATNFISGSIQYSTKILTDFYVETLTGSIKYEKTRRNLYSMLTVLTPKGWQNAPDWVYGGDMSNFYGETMTSKAPGIEVLDKSVDAYADKALKIYGMVERYWKKVIATSENVGDLKSLNMVTKEGLKLPDAEEKAIIDEINSEVDLFAYDYDNVPTWLQNYQQHPLAQAVKPFAKYPYKYTKQVSTLIESAFDQTLPWQERIAKIMALGTLIALYAYVREKQKEKQTTPEVDDSAPAAVNTRGRLYVGTDEQGNELFTRTAKYPFVNLTEAGALFLEGNTSQGFKTITDMVGGVAPAGQLAAAALGYKNEYQQYTPVPVIAGQALASFVPGTRILSDIARFFDPYQRKQQTFIQGFTSFYPTTDPALQEKLRGKIRTIQVPLEGSIEPAGDVEGEGKRRTTTDMYVRNYKTDILLGLLGGIYINRIDPDVAEAFKIRKEINIEKALKKGEE